MMIATTPFVAVGFLFSLTAEEADLGRRSGGKEKKLRDVESATADGAESGGAVSAKTPPEKVVAPPAEKV